MNNANLLPVILSGGAGTRLWPISREGHPKPFMKLAMEYMSRPFFEKLPIVITRPFNYTGVGYASNFVIPKIVDHFKQKATSIELGNLEVLREYNDVRDICQMYLRLLELGQPGLTYNLATGRTHSLGAVIGILQNLCGYEIAVKSNPQFMRANEIYLLAGDGARLQKCIGTLDLHSLGDTLKWMLDAQQAPK